MLASITKANENSKKLMVGLITRKEAVISFIPTPEERKMMFADYNYMKLVRLTHWSWGLYSLKADQELEKDFPEIVTSENENKFYLIPGYPVSLKTINLMKDVRDKLWPKLPVETLMGTIDDGDSFSAARVTYTIGEFLDSLDTYPNDPGAIFPISEEKWKVLDKTFLDQVFE